MRIALLCLILIVGTGCTEATPQFEDLGEEGIPRPKFSGSYLKQITTGDNLQTFQINGECDKKIRSINGFAVGTTSTFGSIHSLAVSGVNVTCSTDGKFSFELKSLSDLGYTVTEGSVYEIQIRSETSAGMSKASLIKILYSTTAGGSRPIRISSGGILGGGDGARASGTAFKADIRVSHQLNHDAVAPQASSEEAYEKSGSSFKARIGIRNNYFQ